jgi:hypothetical protein
VGVGGRLLDGLTVVKGVLMLGLVGGTAGGGNWPV